MMGIPDIIVLRQNLARRFVGQRISDFKIYWEKCVNVPSTSLIDVTVNSSLIEIRRVGQVLQFVLDHGFILGIKVSQKAKFYLLGREATDSILFEMKFSSGAGFGVDDGLGQTLLLLNPTLSTASDVFHPSCTVSYLKKSVYLRRNDSIKAFLMRDPKIRGLGSTYLDEVLWVIQVAPHSLVGKIPESKFRELIPTARQIICEAVERISSLTGPEELIADRRDFLNISNAGKKYDPNGFPIMKIVIHHRKTYWSDSQRIYQ
ncbi:hypothetical protein IQ277_34150 [Nostocales cyanobacterium LEGE 12452]|nr:hypothetical protein [Nostocales cyanobacterium LEGE 12452]